MYISSNSIFLSSFILKGVKCRMFKYVWMANWCFKAMFLSDQILRTVDQRSAWMLRFVAGRQMPFWAMLASLQSLVAPHCWLINGLINGLWKGFVFFCRKPLVSPSNLVGSSNFPLGEKTEFGGYHVAVLTCFNIICNIWSIWSESWMDIVHIIVIETLKMPFVVLGVDNRKLHSDEGLIASQRQNVRKRNAYPMSPLGMAGSTVGTGCISLVSRYFTYISLYFIIFHTYFILFHIYFIIFHYISVYFSIYHIYFIIFHYISLCFIILHYFSLYFSMCEYISLYFIIFHYISVYFSIFHYISLYFIIFQYISLYFIIFHYISLYFIIFHYISLCFIILHYLSLYFSIFQYISLYFIIYHYISLYFIIFHYISLYFIIFHYISVYFIIFHYISWYFIIFHDISLYFIIFHYVSLYFIIFHYISVYFSIFHYISLYFSIFHYISLYFIIFHYEGSIQVWSMLKLRLRFSLVLFLDWTLVQF